MSHPKRVFCSLSDRKKALPVGTQLHLSPRDSHHFKNVLRISAGEQLTVVSKTSGREYVTEIISISDEVCVSVLKESEKTDYYAPVRTIIFSSSKGKKNDLVCEKATELGVEKIIFCNTDRSIARISPDKDSSNKIARWKRIAEAASKQSERTTLPEIYCFADLKSMLEYLSSVLISGDELLCFSLSGGAVDLFSALTKASAAHILIGPEGGLTAEEEHLLVKQGFKLVKLGPCRLRSETAAIAAIASVQTVLGKVR